MRAGDFRADLADRFDGGRVLPVHQGDGVGDAHRVQCHRFGQALLGQQVDAVVHVGGRFYGVRRGLTDTDGTGRPASRMNLRRACRADIWPWPAICLHGYNGW